MIQLPDDDSYNHSKINDSSNQLETGKPKSFFGGEKRYDPNNETITIKKNLVIQDYYEYDSFPKSRNILDWNFFVRDFLSKDLGVTQKLKEQCYKDATKMIDLRPYMIENPETITKFDFLPKIHRRFTQLHLRHLTVVNPVTGKLEGMVTR